MTSTVNIHEAKSRLSQLLEGVRQGEPFVIAKAGKPIARVTRIDAPGPGAGSRIGFLAGQIAVPDDFDRMGEAEVVQLFGGDDAPAA